MHGSTSDMLRFFEAPVTSGKDKEGNLLPLTLEKNLKMRASVGDEVLVHDPVSESLRQGWISEYDDWGCMSKIQFEGGQQLWLSLDDAPFAETVESGQGVVKRSADEDMKSALAAAPDVSAIDARSFF